MVSRVHSFIQDKSLVYLSVCPQLLLLSCVSPAKFPYNSESHFSLAVQIAAESTTHVKCSLLSQSNYLHFIYYEGTVHNTDCLFCPSLLSSIKWNIFSVFHLIPYYCILLLLMPCTEYLLVLLCNTCWEWYIEASLLLSSLLGHFPVLWRDF